MRPTLVWFRQDLRLADHPALAAACGDSDGVVLDTGNDANLGFYGRHGYRGVASVEVGPLREHVLLREPQRG